MLQIYGYNILSNLVATSQSSYDILAILYFLRISERMIYLTDDITISLHVMTKCL